MDILFVYNIKNSSESFQVGNSKKNLDIFIQAYTEKNITEPIHLWAKESF